MITGKSCAIIPQKKTNKSISKYTIWLTVFITIADQTIRKYLFGLFVVQSYSRCLAQLISQDFNTVKQQLTAP